MESPAAKAQIGCVAPVEAVSGSGSSVAPRRPIGKVPAWPTGGVRPTARTQAQFLPSTWGRRAAGTTGEAKGPSQRIQDLSVRPLAFPRAVGQGPPSPGPFLTLLRMESAESDLQTSRGAHPAHRAFEGTPLQAGPRGQVSWFQLRHRVSLPKST